MVPWNAFPNPDSDNSPAISKFLSDMASTGETVDCMPLDGSSSDAIEKGEPPEVMAQKTEEWELLCQKLTEMRDAELEARMDVAKLTFERDLIVGKRFVERSWVEVRFALETALIRGNITPLSPGFTGSPAVFRKNLREKDLIMSNSADKVRAMPSVGCKFRAILCKMGLNTLGDLRSEKLKRKWAQLEDLAACDTKKAKVSDDAVEEEGMCLSGMALQDQDDEGDDGKLWDLKRLDKEILELTDDKVEWRKSFKESYKWYYPYAELSAREKYLASLVDKVAKLVEERSRAVPTDSEVFCYRLLDILATSAMSSAVSHATFPPP